MQNNVEMANDEGSDPTPDIEKQNGQPAGSDETTPAKPGDGATSADEPEAHPS